MDELCKEDGSEVGVSGNVVRLSGPFIQIIEIRIEDKISSWDWEPIIIRGVVVGYLFGWRDQMRDLFDLIELWLRAFDIGWLKDNPWEVDNKEDK